MINNEESKDLFIIKSGNEWLQEASTIPDAKMLFRNLFAELEVAILFADNGAGKSIFAVQIGIEIAKNGKKVLYLDFELTLKQFSKRYSSLNNETGERNDFVFPDNFHRTEINPDANIQNFQKELFERVEVAIQKEKYDVFIFDNLTAIMEDDGKDTKIVLNLLKKVRELRTKYGISALILAHTPKTTPYNPITKNDLAGSKMLSNLVDNIFAIGVSTQGKNIRYVKQLKVRDEKFHEADNVIICEIAQENNFLHFKEVGFSHEREHLQDRPETEKERIRKQAIEIKKENPSISSRDASIKMGGTPSHTAILDIWKKECLV